MAACRVLASNRDEFLARETTPAAWHSDDTVLSGIDAAGKAGGTWLGISRDGRVGVLYVLQLDSGRLINFSSRLNIRDDTHPPNPPSRGILVKRYLSSPHTSLRDLEGSVDAYEGFNLLTFNVQTSEPSRAILSNRGSRCVNAPTDRWAGISNSPVDHPWPKVVDGVHDLLDVDGADEDVLIRRLFRVLRSVYFRERCSQLIVHSRTVPLNTFDDRMHATLVPAVNVGDAENAQWYGTRLSTVILVRDDGTALFIERDIIELDPPFGWKWGAGERRYEFEIQQS